MINLNYCWSYSDIEFVYRTIAGSKSFIACNEASEHSDRCFSAGMLATSNSVYQGRFKKVFLETQCVQNTKIAKVSGTGLPIRSS